MPKPDDKPGKPDVHVVVAHTVKFAPGDRVLVMLKGNADEAEATDVEARLRATFPDVTFTVVRSVTVVAVESSQP